MSERDRGSSRSDVRPPECPVCLGVRLARVELGHGPDLELDACTRCGGIWFDRGEVARLRKCKPKALWKKITPPEPAFRGPCHGCGAKMDRNAPRCPACGRENTIACPQCEAVTLRRHDRLELDACDQCKGVWFDGVELARIWNGELDRLLSEERHANAGVPATRRDEAPSAVGLVDVLAADPFFTLWAVDTAAEVTGTTLTVTGNVLAAAPEAAATVLEGTGELAGSVFEVIVDIIGGIFS